VGWEMASEAQIRANRRNGELSKGPKSEAGKARSAQNALKHGLRSRRLWAIKSEEHDLLKLAEGLWACHAPVGPQEETLVKLMIYDLLTIDRLQRIESSVLNPSLANSGLKTNERGQSTCTEIDDFKIENYMERIEQAIDTLDLATLERINQVEREKGMRPAWRL
jgi:hypothetical protein